MNDREARIRRIEQLALAMRIREERLDRRIGEVDQVLWGLWFPNDDPLATVCFWGYVCLDIVPATGATVTIREDDAEGAIVGTCTLAAPSEMGIHYAKCCFGLDEEGTYHYTLELEGYSDITGTFTVDEDGAVDPGPVFEETFGCCSICVKVTCDDGTVWDLPILLEKWNGTTWVDATPGMASAGEDGYTCFGVSPDSTYRARIAADTDSPSRWPGWISDDIEIGDCPTEAVVDGAMSCTAERTVEVCVVGCLADPLPDVPITVEVNGCTSSGFTDDNGCSNFALNGECCAGEGTVTIGATEGWLESVGTATISCENGAIETSVDARELDPDYICCGCNDPVAKAGRTLTVSGTCGNAGFHTDIPTGSFSLNWTGTGWKTDCLGPIEYGIGGGTFYMYRYKVDCISGLGLEFFGAEDTDCETVALTPAGGGIDTVDCDPWSISGDITCFDCASCSWVVT